MGKLSIPTLNSLKRLPALSLLVASPFLSVSQSLSTDSLRAFPRVLSPKIEAERDLIVTKTLDSLFQTMKPRYVDYYEPETHYTPKIRRKCLHTQATISKALLQRKEMPVLGRYRTSTNTVYINKTVHIDNKIIDFSNAPHILEHELFHIGRRDKVKENMVAYKHLPIDQMKEQLQLEGVDWIGAFPEEVKKYSNYIGSNEEVYARARNIESHLQIQNGIARSAITTEHLVALRTDPGFKDWDFLDFIKGFEEEIVIYIKTIVPSR